MSTQYPPPPPAPSLRRMRPGVVTKYATYLFVATIIITVFSVLEFILYSPPWSYLIGIITALLAIFTFIDGVGLFLGQSWALTIGGYANRAWTQTPEVREYFELQTAYPAAPNAPTTAPPPPPCPTCGQPLKFVQQYQKWYCDKEQKYV